MPSNNTVRTPIVNKKGVLTHVHKKADNGKGAPNRLKSVATPPVAKRAEIVSPQQSKVLKGAYNLELIAAQQGKEAHASLVSGHEYRSAQALANKGLGSLRYQGQSLGWFTLNDKGRTVANFERLIDEAKNTDRDSANYNTDMDVTVAGTTKTYRDMILDGINPNNQDDSYAWIEREQDEAIRR